MKCVECIGVKITMSIGSSLYWFFFVSFYILHDRSLHIVHLEIVSIIVMLAQSLASQKITQETNRQNES